MIHKTLITQINIATYKKRLTQMTWYSSFHKQMLPFTIQFTLDIHTRFKVRNIQRSKSPHQLCRLVIHFQCCFRTDLSHFVINFVYHLRYHLCKLSLLYPQVYHRCVDYGDLNKDKNDDHQNRIMHFLKIKTTNLEVIVLICNILRWINTTFPHLKR